MDELNRPFNYGKLYHFFRSGRWIKGGSGIEYKAGLGQCYCLSVALWRLYEPEETLAIREKLLKKIEEVYPERTSNLATKMARFSEPMAGDKYSLIAFNDHIETDLSDILTVVGECEV